LESTKSAIAEKSYILFLSDAASLAGLIQRRDRSPTTPNVICGRVVSILPRHLATNIESLAATMPPFHHFSKRFKLETKKTKHGVCKNLKRATEGKKVAQKESKKVKREAFANDD
jgi:hypothetical protein